MTEQNKIILEKRYERHEGMLHATFGLAWLAACIALVALWRTL